MWMLYQALWNCTSENFLYLLFPLSNSRSLQMHWVRPSHTLTHSCTVLCINMQHENIIHDDDEAFNVIIYILLYPVMADIADPYLRAHSMLTLLQALPDVNRNTLLFLLHHLRRYTTSFQLVTARTLISFHLCLNWITFGIDGCKYVFNCSSPSRTSSLFMCFSVLQKGRKRIKCLWVIWPQCLAPASYAP